MSDYMPKCATCEHFESCIMQKHITEMALILWNISREKEKERTVNKPRRKRERVMAELKPCPFCGRIPKIEYCENWGYFVICECGIEQSELYKQKCDAVKHWNKRKESER